MLKRSCSGGRPFQPIYNAEQQMSWQGCRRGRLNIKESTCELFHGEVESSFFLLDCHIVVVQQKGYDVVVVHSVVK
jgi:hypothetical protein